MQLTRLFKQCRTFIELKNLDNGQKDKNYFDYIHACVCFSQAIKLFTQYNEHKNITLEELTAFKDKALSNCEEFDARALANIANDAVKLLDYGQKKA